MPKRIQYLLMSVTAIGLGLGIWFFVKPDATGDASADASNDNTTDEKLAVVDLPPVASSRFTNTGKKASYVGPAACAKCHQDEHASYLETPHSRALADVILVEEPDVGEFTHALSNRKYEVVHRSNQMWHRESLRDKAGPDILLAEYPMRYTIGSGHHSRSYLIEVDGFLMESPVTWYTSQQAWSVSPGYDVSHPPSFGRMADIGCVICHVGRVESVDGSRYRTKIHDQSISCESCHGPGSLHVQKHRDGKNYSDILDLTIVNPSHLTRAQSEATCGQCHLRGAASVVLRGRSIQGFRPGLRLTDFRADYQLEHPEKEMKVVGHVEQMRLSRCYQESTTLTCTTCHDPHAKPPSEQRVEYFRQKCLECHAVDKCQLDQEQRLLRDQQDNCVACHMPQSPTDIPHFAFTHHRIGIHSTEETKSDTEVAATTVGTLVPMLDISHLPEIERKRCLGLAYMELSGQQKTAKLYQAYRQRAIELLEAVSKAGLSDADVESTLARIYWKRDEIRRAIRFADAALKSPGTSGAKGNAMFVLADSYLSLNEIDKALPVLNKLVGFRRQSEDWFMLALCHRSHSEIPRTIECLLKAIEISPSHTDARAMLVELYEQRGKTSAAKMHRRIAKLLGQESHLGP
jgi:hypothetical protein